MEVSECQQLRIKAQLFTPSLFTPLVLRSHRSSSCAVHSNEAYDRSPVCRQDEGWWEE